MEGCLTIDKQEPNNKKFKPIGHYNYFVFTTVKIQYSLCTHCVWPTDVHKIKVPNSSPPIHEIVIDFILAF